MGNILAFVIIRRRGPFGTAGGEQEPKQHKKNGHKIKENTRVSNFRLLLVSLSVPHRKQSSSPATCLLPSTAYMCLLSLPPPLATLVLRLARQLLKSYIKGGGAFMTALFTSVSASVCRHAHTTHTFKYTHSLTHSLPRIQLCGVHFWGVEPTGRGQRQKQFHFTFVLRHLLPHRHT